MANSCRLCGNNLASNPILELDGMPKAAQYYPEKDEFSSDHGIPLNVYQCSSCGLVQLNIEPVDYYKEVITAATLSEKSRASRLSQMKEFSKRFNLKAKKILDVGAAKGEMLNVLEEAGYEAFGIEASDNSVKIGLENDRNMIHAFIGDTEFIPHAPFDAFISLNFLEHLPHPGDVIKNLYNNTTGNAVGFLTVPNLDYLLKTNSFYEFVADHLSYFTQDTIRYAFESNGFKVLDCSLINEENDIAVTVKKRENLNIVNGLEEVEDLKNHLRRLASDYTKKRKKIAIWGAGHRTLALLALSSLDTVEYIVDSAEFKQGKYSPVMHTPIVSPNQLRDMPVDLLIIMVPGIYPDEVKKTVLSMNLNMDIAMLKDNKIVFS
jgi:2-polyprenyl-3-methyl-5-hydroxy-6-metoxy-1,4-benzoquinol methylase